MSTDAQPKRARANVALVGKAEAWPEAGALPLEVVDRDGEFGWIFTLDGGAEVWLTSRDSIDGKTLAIPLGFATLNQANRAGSVLADAFAEVRAIQEEGAPRVEACKHSMVWEGLLSRDLVRHRICELCGEHLGSFDLRRRSE